MFMFKLMSLIGTTAKACRCTKEIWVLPVWDMYT